jgi:hypothetical protein
MTKGPYSKPLAQQPRNVVLRFRRVIDVFVVTDPLLSENDDSLLVELVSKVRHLLVLFREGAVLAEKPLMVRSPLTPPDASCPLPEMVF